MTSFRPGLLRLVLLALALVATLTAASLYHLSEGSPLWWLLNAEPPRVEAPSPPGPQRGVIVLDAAVQPGTRADIVAVSLDGAPVPLPEVVAGHRDGDAPTPPTRLYRLRLDTGSLADGRHTLTLHVADRSLRRNRASREVMFSTDNTAPRLRLESSSGQVRAGVPVLVRWGANEAGDLRLTWGDDPLPPLSDPPGASSPQEGVSVVAVPVETGAGDVAVRLAGRDLAGNGAEKTLPLVIEAAILPRQALAVPESLATLATGPVARNEAAQVVSLTSAITAARSWLGPFRPPLAVGAPRTTGFGDRRDYADGHVIYHAGYDLAAPAGAAVMASAGGTVVFSAGLPQRGNTVILDHGRGVYTLYAHLLRFEVEAGQRVPVGQPVGLVGSTGLSTGPHLHWEVRLRGLPIDPGAWLTLSEELASTAAGVSVGPDSPSGG